eukprot:scaffold2668_cov319-Prasinococcus_capsulatus_cf.AAC.5
MLVASGAVPPLVCLVWDKTALPQARRNAALALGALTFHRLGCRAVRVRRTIERELEGNGCLATMHHIPSLRSQH